MQTLEQLKDEWLVRALRSQGLVDEKTAESVRGAGTPYASSELIRRRALTKAQLAGAVREQYNISFLEPSAASLDKLALSLVPERLCRKHLMIPIRVRDEQLDLLMANPIDVAASEDAATVSGRSVRPVFGLPERIEKLIAEAYGSDSVIYDLLMKFPEEAPVEWLGEDSGDVETEAADFAMAAPVIRLANALIAQAVRMGASDVHLEHEESFSVVRYRIDGDMRNIMKLPKHLGEGPLVSRIKIMANLDVADRRRPQDGRAKLLVGGQEVGLRVSTIPTAFGEKVVLRVLDSRQAQVPLERLGFRPEILERIIKLSHSDKGLVLMTGPTGSGKTTTLYSVLNRLKSPDINVVTVEDPIEYRLAGINQVQVNEKAGLTFAAVLRSVLRQDPDVVLVGEIRDRETADIAFQAALTGHMVFSTLHTNDAFATINRLVDMKVERFKLAPALSGVISQRLVRGLCAQCRVEEDPSPQIASLLRKWSLPVRQYRGKGCRECAFSGLRGRTAIVELLDLSEQAARDHVYGGSDSAALRRRAVENGWLLPLEQDVLCRLSAGDIPAQEALGFLETSSDSPPRGEPVRAGGGHGAPASPAPHRVLIVDDNSENRTLVRDTLRMDGCDCLEAESGAAALSKIEETPPDLIVLDVMMPGMDGLAVLKRLRGQMKLLELPVLILTAMNEAESQAVALELGADDYLTKPFEPRVFRARVQALFRRREMRVIP